MTYWIIPVQEDFWEAVSSLNVFGHNKERATRYIKKGDLLIFYVNKYYAKRLGGMFVGIYRVSSDWYTDTTPLFPDEKLQNKVIHTYRINIEPLLAGKCPVRDILYELSFIEDKFQFSKFLRNVPGNLRRPVPVNDAKLIEECIKKSNEV
ncbi:hypothetical protein SUSAZ_01260 [Sulfolobus acidocaldarius SUSAZ]|nr:hypothetical protein SUSAZ_01260 [Sulfolobus acidocaldarius SUSAZ]